jgi:tryptophan-rich sensory protein
MRRWATLIAWLVICGTAAVLGAVPTAASLRMWYPSLVKPSWNPPNAVFGPVWTVLYALMAVAAWRVERQRSHPQRLRALAIFVVQLLLNVAWSWIFFGLQSPGMAAIEVVFLWAAILATIVAFWPIDRVAAFLMVPYLAWVTFATALNIAIWRLNH